MSARACARYGVLVVAATVFLIGTVAEAGTVLNRLGCSKVLAPARRPAGQPSRPHAKRLASMDFARRRCGSSYSGAAANIPAINNMNPKANERSSGPINENIRRRS
jgi:hypothetical protein